LGIDPIELRLINAAEKGTRRATGPLHNHIGVRPLLEAMKEHDHYNSPLVGPNRGRGVAIGFWFNIGLPSTCSITVTENGKLNLSEGNPDMGGTRTTIAMQAAEALGLDAYDVNPNVVDTDLIGFTELTAGSRTTFATGYAAYEAALDVKRQMIKRIGEIWGVKSTDIEYSKRVFTNRKDSKMSVTFEELAGKLNRTGGPIMGTGSVDPKGVGGSVAGNIFDLEVDLETGKITILRVTAFQDAGKAVHPSYVEGQMQGGSAQGIGWALNEEYCYDEQGTMANSSFLDYRLPTALDLPMIDTVILEIANPGHPYGVRGVGEASIIPPPAAIANAVRDAIGKRMTNLPMNPGAVLETIWGVRSSDS
jgi:CO/xanthine dehydrogenase Mo-binding subunit